jgi:hypothetical protein
MIGIKRKLTLLAAGAAMAVSGSMGAYAAPATNLATTMAPSDDGITFVGGRRFQNGGGGGGWKSGGGNWKGNGGNWKSGGNWKGNGGNWKSGGNWNGNGGKWKGNGWQGGGNKYSYYKGRHGHHGHHGNNGIWFAAPFLAAPFLYDSYDDYGYYGYSSYGNGGGNSCYQACREEHGPRFCRYNWEDYC